MEQLPTGVSYESNPFPTSANEWETSPRLFMDHFVALIRELHDRDGAGDSSFPWQLMLKTAARPVWNPGSEGRFVHPSYGIIKARWVQFVDQDETLWAGSPQGFVAGGFSWQVTNKIASSHAALCAGIQASYTTVTDNNYGWVIVDGVNPQSIKYTGAAPALGGIIGWSSDEHLGAATPMVARVTQPTAAVSLGGSEYELPPASIRIKVE